MQIDYLIIGQGLAGSLLAWELIQNNKTVIIVDNGKENASLIAAGLINPVTGMRFVKSSNVDQLLPHAINYYQKLSNHFQQRFYIEKTMLRVLRNDKELLACQKRLTQQEYDDFLAQIEPSHPFVKSSFGLLTQKQTGYLLTEALLSSLKNYFISAKVYRCAEINYQEIDRVPLLRWRDLLPKQIIFSEGYRGASNPWFSWLPFQPVKGEIVTATASNQIPQNIINYGHWFIPLNGHKFRTGATFDRECLDTCLSGSAKERLLTSLKQVLPDLADVQMIKQQAGIRPTTLDKQPFIGIHPDYSEFSMFNGFGAKGSLQIPWYCQAFVAHLLNRQDLPKSSSILRYYH